MKTAQTILFICLLGLASGCREKYEMSFKTEQLSFLVVEGIINTQGATKINLTRTTQLSDKGIAFENNALVEIHSEDNVRYPLVFMDSGRYVSPELSLNEETKYRLSIRTADSREYLSSFVTPIQTPEIDSITWTLRDGGIEIFANARDIVNNTQYYKFDYEETWEFRSFTQAALITVFKRDPPRVGDIQFAAYDPIRKGYDTSIYACWKSQTSNTIKIANTLKLEENQLYAPLVWYPRGAWQLSVLYSMNLHQQGLSREGYEFYRRMQKNTESLGSIFDPQPSEISGNIYCTSDTSEKVIGFIDASRVKTKRVFISNADLDGWVTNNDCRIYTIDKIPEVMYNWLWTLKFNIVDTSADYPLAYIAEASCMDCTLRGSNIKPDFWPN